MSEGRKLSWTAVVAVVLMLAALFAYVASLDDSDPDALDPSAVQLDEGAP